VYFHTGNWSPLTSDTVDICGATGELGRTLGAAIGDGGIVFGDCCRMRGIAVKGGRRNGDPGFDTEALARGAGLKAM
jgi:hypothetical protein